MVARVFIRPGDKAEWKNGVAGRGGRRLIWGHTASEEAVGYWGTEQTQLALYIWSPEERSGWGRARLWWQFKPRGRGTSEGTRGPQRERTKEPPKPTEERNQKKI